MLQHYVIVFIEEDFWAKIDCISLTWDFISAWGF